MIRLQRGLPMSEPQKFSKRPLYLQVRDLLAQRIAQGEWKPGSMLPSEDELARELGVSMGTMRKALDGLEEERLVLRRQGRGTSVVDQTSDAMLNRFNGLTDESGKPIGGDFEVLQQTTRHADAVEQARLPSGSTEMVLHITRLRRDRGRPLMYEEVVFGIEPLARPRRCRRRQPPSGHRAETRGPPRLGRGRGQARTGAAGGCQHRAFNRKHSRRASRSSILGARRVSRCLRPLATAAS